MYIWGGTVALGCLQPMSSGTFSLTSLYLLLHTLQNFQQMRGVVRKRTMAWGQACLVMSWHAVKYERVTSMMTNLSNRMGHSSPVCRNGKEKEKIVSKS